MSAAAPIVAGRSTAPVCAESLTLKGGGEGVFASARRQTPPMLVASASPAERQGRKALPDCAAACPELSLQRWSQISLIDQPRIPMHVMRHGRLAALSRRPVRGRLAARCDG